MDRGKNAEFWALANFPHARGDGPESMYTKEINIVFSPRTWGWTDETIPNCSLCDIFPTHVGMDRGKNAEFWALATTKFSPRTWGWTVPGVTEDPPEYIFPTHVGMDRRYKSSLYATLDFPHARGDGP